MHISKYKTHLYFIFWIMLEYIFLFCNPKMYHTKYIFLYSYLYVS